MTSPPSRIPTNCPRNGIRPRQRRASHRSEQNDRRVARKSSSRSGLRALTGWPELVHNSGHGWCAGRMSPSEERWPIAWKIFRISRRPERGNPRLRPPRHQAFLRPSTTRPTNPAPSEPKQKNCSGWSPPRCFAAMMHHLSPGPLRRRRLEARRSHRRAQRRADRRRLNHTFLTCGEPLPACAKSAVCNLERRS